MDYSQDMREPSMPDQIKIMASMAGLVKWGVVSLAIVGAATVETVQNVTKWPLLIISLLISTAVLLWWLSYRIIITGDQLAYRSLVDGKFLVDRRTIKEARLGSKASFRHDIAITDEEGILRFINTKPFSERDTEMIIKFLGHTLRDADK